MKTWHRQPTPLLDMSADNLASTAQETSEVPKQAPSLTAFIASRNRGTLGVLTEAARHLAVSLLWKYVGEGILVHTKPSWTQKALEKAIPKGCHTSACTPEMTAFVREEMRQCVRYGISSRRGRATGPV